MNSYIKLYEFVQSVFEHMLWNTEEGESGLAYLKGRGFNDEIIKKYGLGRTLKNNAMTKLLNNHHYDLDEMVDNGLLRKKEDGSYRDFFSGRITIPLHDDEGKIIGFSGRTLPHNTHPAKYINTPETKFFKKRELLYNFCYAKESIKRNNFCLIMEGYFDVLASVQNNISNVVGTMGTALTIENVLKLRELTSRAILIFDGDKAGLEAAKRNAELLLENNFDVRIAVIPNEDDPQEYIMKYGIDIFSKEVIGKAKQYYDFMEQYLASNIDLSNEVDCLNYVNGLLEVVRFAPLEKQRKIFSNLASQLNVNIQLIHFYVEQMVK